jgi:hypothetical protein
MLEIWLVPPTRAAPHDRVSRPRSVTGGRIQTAIL